MEASIPVIIDDVKKYPHFNMSRASYFVVTSFEPMVEWNVYSGRSLPISIVGIEGIIHEPLGRYRYFRNADLIDELYRTLEIENRTIIDVNDLWIPNEILPADVQGQQVYRVGLSYFFEALSYRNGGRSTEHFIEISLQFHKTIRYSEDETNAFAEWQKRQINGARENYYQSRFQLEKKQLL